MIFDINDIANIGSVRDVPAYQLPPEVWTRVLNMRYDNTGLQTLDGWGQVFGTPLYAPHFAMFASKGGALFTAPSTPQSILLYTSLVKAAVYDGTSHVDATRASGDYTATETRQWNGTMLGGVPVVNNGVDPPQFMSTFTSGTLLDDLTNWPATLKAKVIRAFGPFLVAIHTKLGANAPAYHRVKWSHPADPGTIPPTWDETDTTKDAGEVDLPDAEAGVLLDLMPLASTMYLYKESSIWRMRYVGGQQIFDFGQSAWISSEGLLATRCVAVTGDGTKHVFATRSFDIAWHNGNAIQSILTSRQKETLRSDIDPSASVNSFMLADPFNSCMWFCYPSRGNDNPNRALILSYKVIGGESFAVTEADGITFRGAAIGNLPETLSDTWDSAVGDWDSDATPWDIPTSRAVVLVNPGESKFFALGLDSQRDGVEFESSVRRDGLALIGKKRNGDLIVDHQRYKMIKRLWPKITGSTVSVRFNSQQVVGSGVVFGGAASYDPETMVFVDPAPMSGRAVGFEITGQMSWRLDGYKIDVVPMGEH